MNTLNQTTPLRLGCVVMAGGNARRYGSNKLAAQIDGKSLIRRALEAVPTEQFCRVVVVTQYPDIARLAEEFGFEAVCSPNTREGISHTIALGLNRLQDCDGALFLVSDQPNLCRATVARLASLWRAQPHCLAALAHGQTRGNPCIFPHSCFSELLALHGDQGGSAVIRRHEDALLLLQTDLRELQDIDTPQDALSHNGEALHTPRG